MGTGASRHLGIAMKLFARIFCLSLAISAVPLPHFMTHLSAQGRDSHSSSYVILSEDDNKSQVKLLLSQTLLIILPAQLGTGFSWHATRSDVSLGTLEKLDESEIQKLTRERILDLPSEKNLPGGTESQVFRLKPTSKGTSQVELRYIRFREPDKPDRKFVVTLNVGSSSNLKN